MVRFRRDGEKSDEGEQAVDNQQLKAEFVAPQQLFREAVEQQAENRGEEGDERDEFREFDLAFGVNAEHKHAQDGAVSVTCHIEDDGNQ